MRYAVIEEIYKQALNNKNIFFITGDLGHAYENEFKKNIPNQYMNIGIAEQNMIGVASGLALSGMKVFVYSIVPFAIMRCFEQIRVDVCSQDLDVTIIGTGAGLVYGQYGNTHCSIEDVALTRVLPNMKVISPSNPYEASELTKQVLNLKGPFYLRLGRGKEPMPDKKYKVSFNKACVIKPGSDISLLTYGAILPEVIKTSRLLEDRGVSVEVINMHTIKPFDEKAILSRLKKRKAIFSIEEHSVIGGLGDAIASIIAERKTDIIFKKFGINDVYLKEIGDQDYLRQRHNLSAAKISKEILKLCQLFKLLKLF